MEIVPHFAVSLFTPPPVSVLMLPAPKPRLMLSAPKIAGYLPAPKEFAAGVIQSELRSAMSPLQESHYLSAVPVQPVRRVVEAEIVNPLILIDIRRDPKAFWAEFERIHGPDKTIEEMDAEIEAKHPGYLAWVECMKAREAARS